MKSAAVISPINPNNFAKRPVSPERIVQDYKQRKPKSPGKRIASIKPHQDSEFDSQIWKNSLQQIIDYSEFHKSHPHCTTPRLKKGNLGRIRNFVQDERNPTKFYTQVFVPEAPILEEFYPQEVGVEGDFVEVTNLVAECETAVRCEKGDDFVDPWWNKTVEERRKEYHVNKTWTPENKEADISFLQMSVDGLTPKERKRREQKEKIRMDKLNDLAVQMEWGKVQRVVRSPWEVPLGHTKYTANGTEMKEYEAIELNQNIEFALAEYRAGVVPSKVLQNSGFSPAAIANLKAFKKMETKLGGEDGIEVISEGFVKFAHKNRKHLKGQQTSWFSYGVDIGEACMKGNTFQVKALLAFGSDPNSLTQAEEPLLWAVFNKVLLIDAAYGAELSEEQLAENKDRKNFIKILDALVEYGAKTNITWTEEKLSLVHAAVITGNRSMVRWAIKAGVEPNMRARNDVTPLMMATRVGNIEMIAELIRLGSLVTDHDIQRRTPLHYAAYYGQLQAALFLMRLNAKRHVLDQDGKLPSKLAEEQNFFVCQQVIIGFAPKAKPAALPLEFLMAKMFNPPPLSLLDKIKNVVSNGLNWMFGRKKADGKEEVQGCWTRLWESISDKYDDWVRFYDDFEWSDLQRKTNETPAAQPPHPPVGSQETINAIASSSEQKDASDAVVPF